MKRVFAGWLSVCLLLGMASIAEETLADETPAEEPAEETTEASSAADSQATQARQREHLEGTELLKTARQALKTWAKVPNEQAENAARELALLYDDLKADTKIPPMAKARVMEDVRKKLETLAKRIERLAKKQERAGQRSQADASPKSVRLPENRKEVVGQFAGAGNADGEMFNRSSELAEANGEQLADLIQNLIKPDSWESNGGAGTIRYWNTRGSLIIYQTVPVHEEIEGTLEQLRRVSN